MEKIINNIRELKKEDIPLVGGKGANLGEMISSNIPVPEGFVVNVNAYREFINTGRIKEEISKILSETDRNDEKHLGENALKIQKIILNAPMLPKISEEIKSAYRKLSGGEACFVAVRSSATAEDVPEASFAGQQATFLNISGEDEVVLNVQKCWASLFTSRAIFYREEQNFKHMEVLIAVVVQRMINSTVSGVMFTSHPITGEEKIVIESGYGLGEGIVSGEITPDTYIVDKSSFEILDKIISSQKIGYTKSEGKTKKVEIKPDVQGKQKLSDENIKRLALIGKNIDTHYNQPMDVEWAEEKNSLYIVQARPVTTIKKKDLNVKMGKKEEEKKAVRKILVKGLGASPGFVSGKVRVLHDLSEMSTVNAGDILVTFMTSPDMVPIMKKARAIITDEGGMTCHAAIVSRELGTPCIVGTKEATKILKTGDDVTVDSTKGIVYEGYEEIPEEKKVQVASVSVSSAVTATEIKANVDFPEVAERAKAFGADGVGLLRSEHMFIEIGEHPMKLIKEGRKDELVDKIAEGIRGVAEVIYPNPVWYRTLDLKTDEFVHLKGGENEPVEANPMIGWRGIRRSIDEIEVLKCEFEAISKLRQERLINIGVMLPMVQHPSEVRKAREIALSVGLDTDKMDFGIMVEIPATAIIIDEFVKEKISFISFGTNDLTQFTLALDRNSSNVAKLYDEMHPAVLRLIKRVINVCKKAGIKTSICGQAGSYPQMVEKLVAMGIDSVSANVDAIQNIRSVAARVEKKLLVDAARKKEEDTL